jgi:hypothetical protein
MKQKLLLTAAVILCVLQTQAQNLSTISGKLKDASGNAVAGATVMLHHSKDSSIAKTAISNNTGVYQLLTVKAGSYFITVSASGMQKASSGTISLLEDEPVIVPIITLKAIDKNLEGVTVVSKKPIVEVKADKTILNVEGTINAVGNDALELLRKSPGVMVDKDDNLSLSGKNGVQVYIDGKPSPLSGADLANYLKSLQSSQIESIELITNPSAKYEAAGNAGIINIKLKKNKAFGTNGSVNAGYAIGTYAKYNGGVSLNNRNKKTNFFGNYNYNQGINENTFNLYRVLNLSTGDTIFDQTNSMKMRNQYNHNYKVGADYYINANNTVGVVINGNASKNLMETSGPMSIIYAPTHVTNRILFANNENNMERDNLNFNFNYRYTGKGGKELNVDADYGFFNINSNQYQPNRYYDGTGTVNLNNNIYRMISPTTIDIYSLKADYEQDYQKGKLGFGGKSGYVSTDNNFNRYNVSDITGVEIKDKDKSNRFKYKEYINAAYVNYNRPFKGFMLQAGLRVENTDSKGNSTGLKYNSNTGMYDNYDSTISRNYTDFFPSAAVTFNKNPMSQFGLTYGRRIDRPAYQDLNPFEFKLNDYAYMKGNTQLRPQYTNSFGITHTYKYKLNTQLNYSHVKDIFTQLPDTTEKSKSFLTKKNLATQDIVSLNVSYPFQYKWYGFFANLNTYYSNYQADFGGGSRKISLDVVALSYYMQNSFKLGKGYTAELSGFYNSPTVWQGTFKSKAMYSVDGGVQKIMLKGKGTLKASVSDIFKTMRFKGTVDFAGQQTTASGHWESRQFKLNFNYRFGNSQVKAARQRKAAIEEENKRTQSSGGIGGN